MMADAAFSSTGNSAAWIAPLPPDGVSSGPPPPLSDRFNAIAGLNLTVAGPVYSGGIFGRTTQGFVTMSEAMLRSIDSRLQKVADDVGTMKLQINTVESKIDTVVTDVKKLPTWWKIWTAIFAGIGVLGTVVAWLANGGAALLAKLFKVG